MSVTILATVTCDRCKKVITQKPLAPNAEGALPETSPDLFEVVKSTATVIGGVAAKRTLVSFRDICPKCDTTIENLVNRILLADEGADLAVNGGPVAAATPKGPKGPRAPKASAPEAPKADAGAASSAVAGNPFEGEGGTTEPPVAGPADGPVEGPANPPPQEAPVEGPAATTSGVSGALPDPNQPF